MSTDVLKGSSVSSWAPLHHKIFRILWIASIASNIGSWMHEVGAGWFMTSLTSNPLMVALVQAATTAPVFLLALPAGALADIVDRRRYLITAQVWMMMAAATLGALTLSGMTTAPILLVFTFALGIGTAMMMPAWGAITPELVPRAELQSAIGLNTIGMNISRSVGPALAGLIVRNNPIMRIDSITHIAVKCRMRPINRTLTMPVFNWIEMNVIDMVSSRIWCSQNRHSVCKIYAKFLAICSPAKCVLQQSHR